MASASTGVSRNGQTFSTHSAWTCSVSPTRPPALARCATGFCLVPCGPMASFCWAPPPLLPTPSRWGSYLVAQTTSFGRPWAACFTGPSLSSTSCFPLSLAPSSRRSSARRTTSTPSPGRGAAIWWPILTFSAAKMTQSSAGSIRSFGPSLVSGRCSLLSLSSRCYSGSAPRCERSVSALSPEPAASSGATMTRPFSSGRCGGMGGVHPECSTSPASPARVTLGV